jgi:hypothetical protein
MPKTAPHVNNTAQSREYEVGLSGQRGHMQPKPETHSMNQLTHEEFRYRVPAPDAAHICRAAFGSEFVGQSLRLNRQIQRKIGNVLEPFSFNHDFNEVDGILDTERLHTRDHLRQSEMIHTVEVSCAKSKRR